MQIPHVSASVFHLVKQWEGLLTLRVVNLLFLLIRHSHHSTKVELFLYRSFRKRLSYIKECVSHYRAQTRIGEMEHMTQGLYA